jgi:alpha-D-ribose 1-methylphosphonate 5-triphosphate diphosphatase
MTIHQPGHQSAKVAPAGAAETVLANARLVLPDEVVTGSVCLRDGRIAAIEPGAAVPRGATDCAGDWLAPGLIELHTDNLERHMQPRPGVKLPMAQAIVAHDGELASVGITTVFDALRVGSVVSDRRSRYHPYAREMSREIVAMRARGALRISHFIHLRAELCSETLAAELDQFGPADRIGIVSLMDHTPGARQFTDTTALRTYLRGKYAMPDEGIDEHIAFQQALGARHVAPHREAAVRRARELGAILASHDDTTEAHAVESVRIGVRLAEFPTTAAAARTSAEGGIAVMMGAPNLLRGGSHSGNVAAHELAALGCLDILSSDYIPISLLAGAVRLGQESGDMAAGLRRVTAAPADAAGLSDRGRIAPGLRADLLRFGIDQGTPVTRGLWVRGERVA